MGVRYSPVAAPGEGSAHAGSFLAASKGKEPARLCGWRRPALLAFQSWPQVAQRGNLKISAHKAQMLSL